MEILATLPPTIGKLVQKKKEKKILPRKGKRSRDNSKMFTAKEPAKMKKRQRKNPGGKCLIKID